MVKIMQLRQVSQSLALVKSATSDKTSILVIAVNGHIKMGFLKSTSYISIYLRKLGQQLLLSTTIDILQAEK